MEIDRLSKNSKKDNVNLLVEFLAAPYESTSSSPAEVVEQVIAKSAETRKRRGRPPKNAGESTPKKKKAKVGRPKKNKDGEEVEDLDYASEEKEEEEGPEDNDIDEVIDGKTIPSAKKLRIWVKAYVACFDLDNCNAKHAIATASEKFKVDLGVKKNTIMEMLKDEIS